MAHFSFTVDTEPMAVSVNQVSERLTATTAAVVAMQAAVIASEKDAADNICENVDKGFYNLIQSQVSSKLAKQFTDMNVKLSLILEYTKTLMATKTRMESDYNRIRREYLKIFKSLDKALENRIGQLDREAMLLAETRKRVIADRFLNEAAGTIHSTREIGMTKTVAVSARLKNKTGKALESLAARIRGNIHYGAQMDSILENEAANSVNREYIPVIYTQEQSVVMQGSAVTQMQFPDSISEKAKNSIGLAVMNQLNTASVGGNSESETEEIRREFTNLLTSAGLEQRVTDTVMRLYAKGGTK